MPKYVCLHWNEATNWHSSSQKRSRTPSSSNTAHAFLKSLLPLPWTGFYYKSRPMKPTSIPKWDSTLTTTIHCALTHSSPLLVLEWIPSHISLYIYLLPTPCHWGNHPPHVICFRHITEIPLAPRLLLWLCIQQENKHYSHIQHPYDISQYPRPIHQFLSYLEAMSLQKHMAHPSQITRWESLTPSQCHKTHVHSRSQQPSMYSPSPNIMMASLQFHLNPTLHLH